MILRADACVGCVVTSPNRGRFQKGQHWRPRRPWWDRDWLDAEYLGRRRSAAEIAHEYGVTENAILFWLKKHGIETRTVSQVRAFKYWGAMGENNPMYGKRGALNGNWKGGQTPARQVLYASTAWRAVERRVKRRDLCCQLCRGTDALEIHHIEPFARAPLLALEIGNLIRLCVGCHRKVGRRVLWWRAKLFQILREQASRVVA